MSVSTAITFERLFGLLCGQNPDHTWELGGVLMPCCERCTGLYVGVLLAALLHWRLRPRLTSRFLWAHGLLFLVMLPCAFGWVTQTPEVRAASGVVYGFAVVTFLVASVRREETLQSGSLVYTAALLATMVLLPRMAAQGGRAMAGLLAGLSFLGALLCAGLTLAFLWSCLQSARRFGEASATEPREAFGGSKSAADGSS